MADSSVSGRIEAFRSRFSVLKEAMSRVIVGQEDVIEQVYACLLGGGNALLEGVPGLGKTLIARTFSGCLGLEFSRIQFTPDLMPADVTGTNVIVEKDGARHFRFQKGPIFANIVLADEINRATPKTQSALLEAMQEHRVTAGTSTYDLSDPFMVLATQNPIELEGTFPLPEAQLDRFMMKIRVGFPGEAELVDILTRTTGSVEEESESVLSLDDILNDQKLVREIALAEPVAGYAASIIRGTHPDDNSAPETARRYIRFGASPRGGQALVMGGKVRALKDGRANVGFEDIAALARPALRHRLILNFEGEAAGIDADDIIDDVVNSVPKGPVS